MTCKLAIEISPAFSNVSPQTALPGNIAPSTACPFVVNAAAAALHATSIKPFASKRTDSSLSQAVHQHA